MSNELESETGKTYATSSLSMLSGSLLGLIGDLGRQLLNKHLSHAVSDNTFNAAYFSSVVCLALIAGTGCTAIRYGVDSEYFKNEGKINKSNIAKSIIANNLVSLTCVTSSFFSSQAFATASSHLERLSYLTANAAFVCGATALITAATLFIAKSIKDGSASSVLHIIGLCIKSCLGTCCAPQTDYHEIGYEHPGPGHAGML